HDAAVGRTHRIETTGPRAHAVAPARHRGLASGGSGIFGALWRVVQRRRGCRRAHPVCRPAARDRQAGALGSGARTERPPGAAGERNAMTDDARVTLVRRGLWLNY